MPIAKTNRIHSLFDDDDPIAADQQNESLSNELPWLKIALIGGVVLIGIVIIWSIRPARNVGDEVGIQLVGARAGQLQPGATVVVGGVRIGSVVALDYQDQQAVATLQLDPKVAAQFTSDTRFYVKSLGSSGHGNIGVEAVVGSRTGEPLPKRIEISEDLSLQDWLKEQIPSSWSDGETVERLDDPASRNLLIVAASIAAIATLSAAFIRLFRALLPVAIFAAVVVAIVYMLIHEGLLPSDWDFPSLTAAKQSLVSE